ncbi:ComEA family DNA-binding protein [Chiayiivirga flava]|uniref:Competence protein ComEA n=1 Tax=Chiayiivirga flava TaxID=659595 RepID=A0A7W8D3K8_9GAMM|nr:helix-hairpin-helix domain-containing protein [Chiayiivirga flava]MBB5207311.1 competence protein ComEA [Chiayiivirga flava]
MNTLRIMLGSLLLSLVLALPAMAADTVDINTADAATLAAVLDGVGDAKAQAIVAYREENGPFQSVDQLAEVKGIGLKTLEKNRDRIAPIGADAPAAAPAAAKSQ